MQNLFGVLDEVEQVTDEMYKNAEMLLDLYRKVKFRVYRNLEEIDEELYIGYIFVIHYKYQRGPMKVS